MYRRIFDIENQLDEGMFLFGARQVGKSTLLQERFPNAVYYDLLIDSVRKAFKRNPDSFREALLAKPAGTLVIVDEIQKVPELLDAKEVRGQHPRRPGESQDTVPVGLEGGH